MGINRDKPDRWKEDIAKSVDYYNAWFMTFAPEAYRNQRRIQVTHVEQTMAVTDYLRHITPELLKQNPLVVQTLRMATAPPLARDRLIGLAYVTPNLIRSMEETAKHSPRVPPRMPEDQLRDELTRVCEILEEMMDRDICPWLASPQQPTREEVRRAATVIADRLCGMAADPIIRNRQEQEQREAIRTWLLDCGYQEVDSALISDALKMEPGTFTFGCTVQVRLSAGRETFVNLPADCIIQPCRHRYGTVPIFVEMKSAGDYTNTNKRRKEEAQKASQLRATFGDQVTFVLFLRGYFDSGYLGYEAAEGLDWVWEHRIDDFLALDLGCVSQKEGAT